MPAVTNQTLSLTKEVYRLWPWVSFSNIFSLNTVQHNFEVTGDYHLKDDPCATISNNFYSNLDSDINARRSSNMFHVANGVFIPDGEKLIVPNFVDPSFKAECGVQKNFRFPDTETCTEPDLKKTAKNTLQHWTKDSDQITF